MSTRVVIGPIRFSYANVYEPKKAEGSEEAKYSTSILIEKKQKEIEQEIRKAIEKEKQENLAKFGGVIPKNLWIPLRDGDVDRPENEDYAGHYFLNASSKTAPEIVDKKRQPILDKTAFYSGCYGYVSLTFYAFNKNGNKGIACGLNNIMKTKDGEPLGGRSRAEDDFAHIVLEEDEENIDDLL